jgi:hypothetical protein
LEALQTQSLKEAVIIDDRIAPLPVVIVQILSA